MTIVSWVLLGAPIEVLRQYVQKQEAGLKAEVSNPGELT